MTLGTGAGDPESHSFPAPDQMCDPGQSCSLGFGFYNDGSDRRILEPGEAGFLLGREAEHSSVMCRKFQNLHQPDALACGWNTATTSLGCTAAHPSLFTSLTSFTGVLSCLGRGRPAALSSARPPAEALRPLLLRWRLAALPVVC